MTRGWTRDGILALLVLLAGGGAAYALLVGKPGPAPTAARQVGPPQVAVSVAAPERRALTVQTQGTVRPLREIKLVSQVGGRVESVSPRFAEGGFFSAGETLVQIERVDYELAIARSESQVAAARQRLAEEEGRALQAAREWRDLGSDKANALFLRKPQLAAAEAALHAAEADLTAARLHLARTAISAPFNGRISEKHVDSGQYVAPGTAVAAVYDTDVVQVRLPLTDRQVALLELPLSYDGSGAEAAPGNAPPGVPVVLRSRFADRQWEWRGRIVRTDASIDVDSRVVYAVAEVAKPFARDPDSERPPLAPGLFVHAAISGRPLPQVSKLPRSALRSDDTVLVVDARQRARARPVHVLQGSASEVWVQGLTSGERVIVRADSPTVAGMEVAVAEPDALAGGGY
ncbi:MAG: efflux RND transporter periplasmic adaptor subunit [Halioglobus sp.]|nr:efflux RND transporter periplasmic adaptor subunit [Halioglobus sp.]